MYTTVTHDMHMSWGKNTHQEFSFFLSLSSFKESKALRFVYSMICKVFG